MFRYRLPDPGFKLNKKALMYFLAVVYVLSLIPMLVIGFYDWPSVDDFSMPLQVHQTFVSTGSVLATLGSVFTKTVYIYNNWVGYFFSDFMTCLCPSVFGEKWYFLTVFVILAALTLCVLYFFDALFVHVFGMEKESVRSAAFLTLILMTQTIENGPSRAEAFYWWSGAINYTFMFGMFLLWMGMILKYVFAESTAGGGKDSQQKKRGALRILPVCILGFLLGGANYMMALVAAVCSLLGLIIVVMVKLGKFELWGDKERIRYLWLPFILNLLGLVVSAMAPGNRIRGTKMGNIGPVKAILRSYYSVFNICVDEMVRWEVLLVFIILAILFWNMASAIKHNLEHPFVFALFSVSMVAVCVVPPLYAVESIDAPRIRSTMWLQFVSVMTLAVFYYVTWARQRISDRSSSREKSFGKVSSVAVIVTVMIIAFGSLLCVYVNPAYYSATSAVYDLVTGTAKGYKAENESRLETLNNDEIRDAVLPPHSYKPELLFQGDIYEDASLWENSAVATYYNKDTVALEKR